MTADGYRPVRPVCSVDERATRQARGNGGRRAECGKTTAVISRSTRHERPTSGSRSALADRRVLTPQADYGGPRPPHAPAPLESVRESRSSFAGALKLALTALFLTPFCSRRV